MAKRTPPTKRTSTSRKKAARPAKTAARKTARRNASRPAKRTASKKRAGTKTAKKTATKRAASKKAASKKVAAGRRPATSASRKAPARKAPRRESSRKAGTAKPKSVAKKSVAKTAPKPSSTRQTKRPARAARPAPIRGAIPSSLGPPSSASSARSGREELLEHLHASREIGPAITAGDLDANWEVAYTSGDEAPGGDNPTPDQDVVDEIGHALGIEYDANEELKGANKVEERDRHRWELDPASAEDYKDHGK